MVCHSQVYQAERSKLHSQLEHEFLTMSVDGWTTSAMENTLGIAINDVLLDLVENGEENHTAQYMSHQTSLAIKHVEDDLDGQIVGLVTDSASNMPNLFL